jgi:hypothetical protein
MLAYRFYMCKPQIKVFLIMKFTCNSYYVPIKGDKTALSELAQEHDMPNGWDFSWPELWSKTNFEYQCIVKLTYEDTLWGLARYSIYPGYNGQNLVEIEHLEANPNSRSQVENRLVEPIGKWLVWYAIQVALELGLTDSDSTLIALASVPESFDYYRDVLEMDYLGPAPSAPGEDGYAFRFTRAGAVAFCAKQEQEWGIPRKIESSASESGG